MICPMAAKLSRADGRIDRTEMTKMAAAFRSFANAPKIL